MLENIRRPDVSILTSEVQRLTRALARDPRNPQLFIQRGMASFQLGLYFEAEQDPERARHYITRAADMHVTEDYMRWVAIVHQHLRGWVPG